MPRPFRIPGGLVGVALLSAPPLVLCAVSMALCPLTTKILGMLGIVTGCLLYAVGNLRAAA